MKTGEQKVVRKTFGDNRWFPGDGARLQKMVEDFISGAQVSNVEGRIVAGIAPHAGFQFSGRIAGHTFRAAKDNAAATTEPETVVVLGFPHRFPGRDIALMDGDAVKSPMGVSPLDGEAASMLTGACPRIKMDYKPHQGEHSAENEIPFIQAAFPKAKLVVAIISAHDIEAVQDLAGALSKLAEKKRILVIASTDMLHDPDYDLVTSTDRETLEKVAAMDWKAVAARWKPDRQVFCGIMPVLTVMKYAEMQGATRGTVLFYRNNGDDDPSSRGSWVVGYGAVVFTAPVEKQ